MIIRGDDQHAMCSQRLQASAHIVNFRVGRETDDRTHRNLVRRPKVTDVFLRDVGQALIIDQVSCLCIQKHARRESLVQQFEGAGGTNIRFPGQHYDGIGLLRMIDNQEASATTIRRTIRNRKNRIKGVS
jgi:hypothetical protein